MRMQLMMEGLARAIERAAASPAGGFDAAAVAAQLAGAAVSFQGQSGVMRATDHQFQQALVVGIMGRQGTARVKFDVEGAGFGFHVVGSISALAAELPTSCKMQRPS